MALDAGEIWEIILKTTKYTLVYVIAMLFIGINFSIVSGFGFFCYSSSNTEKLINCFANSSDYPFYDLDEAERAKYNSVDVSRRFDLIFKIGFWVYILAWLSYVVKLSVSYCVGREILFF